MDLIDNQQRQCFQQQSPTDLFQNNHGPDFDHQKHLHQHRQQLDHVSTTKPTLNNDCSGSEDEDDFNVLDSEPALYALKREQLRSLCRARGLRTVGEKGALITRLLDYNTSLRQRGGGSASQTMKRRATDVSYDMIDINEGKEANNKVASEFGGPVKESNGTSSNSGFKEKFSWAFRNSKLLQGNSNNNTYQSLIQNQMIQVEQQLDQMKPPEAIPDEQQQHEQQQQQQEQQQSELAPKTPGGSRPSQFAPASVEPLRIRKKTNTDIRKPLSESQSTGENTSQSSKDSTTSTITTSTATATTTAASSDDIFSPAAQIRLIESTNEHRYSLDPDEKSIRLSLPSKGKGDSTTSNEGASRQIPEQKGYSWVPSISSANSNNAPLGINNNIINIQREQHRKFTPSRPSNNDQVSTTTGESKENATVKMEHGHKRAFDKMESITSHASLWRKGTYKNTSTEKRYSKKPRKDPESKGIKFMDADENGGKLTNNNGNDHKNKSRACTFETPNKDSLIAKDIQNAGWTKSNAPRTPRSSATNNIDAKKRLSAAARNRRKSAMSRDGDTGIAPKNGGFASRFFKAAASTVKYFTGSTNSKKKNKLATSTTGGVDSANPVPYSRPSTKPRSSRTSELQQQRNARRAAGSYTSTGTPRRSSRKSSNLPAAQPSFTRPTAASMSRTAPKVMKPKALRAEAAKVRSSTGSNRLSNA